MMKSKVSAPCLFYSEWGKLKGIVPQASRRTFERPEGVVDARHFSGQSSNPRNRVQISGICETIGTSPTCGCRWKPISSKASPCGRPQAIRQNGFRVLYRTASRQDGAVAIPQQEVGGGDRLPDRAVFPLVPHPPDVTVTAGVQVLHDFGLARIVDEGQYRAEGAPDLQGRPEGGRFVVYRTDEHAGHGLFPFPVGGRDHI